MDSTALQRHLRDVSQVASPPVECFRARKMYITVVELPEYIRRSERLLDENERNSLIDYLAVHPKDGKIMQRTGGIRKIRWARKGKGKRGGVRVIYYFYDETIPLFLLTIFGKGEKENLSKAERNALSKLTQELLKIYKGKIK